MDSPVGFARRGGELIDLQLSSIDRRAVRHVQVRMLRTGERATRQRLGFVRLRQHAAEAAGRIEHLHADGGGDGVRRRRERRLERAPAAETNHYQYGPLMMDLGRHEVRLGEKEVPLTAKEFGLLEHLLRNPGRVLTRDVLLNAVWGYDYYGTTRTVDVHIRRLKQKLPLLDEAIVSVKSMGYKLKEL